MEQKNSKPKKFKKLKTRLLSLLIVILFLVGLALIFNKTIRNMMIATTSNHYQIAKVSKETIAKNQKVTGNFNFDDVRAVNFASVLGSQFNQQVLPVIGGVAVPAVGINLPIFNGFGPNSIALAYGASTMKADQVMGQGNYALASHNVTGYDKDLSLLFTPLEHAKSGMLIYITDKTTIYQYRITDVTTVTPDHVEVIEDEPGKTEVTLVTCADQEALRRIIVRGTFEKKVPFTSGTSEMLSAFEKGYNQLNNY